MSRRHFPQCNKIFIYFPHQLFWFNNSPSSCKYKLLISLPIRQPMKRVTMTSHESYPYIEWPFNSSQNQYESESSWLPSTPGENKKINGRPYQTVVAVQLKQELRRAIQMWDKQENWKGHFYDNRLLSLWTCLILDHFLACAKDQNKFIPLTCPLSATLLSSLPLDWSTTWKCVGRGLSLLKVVIAEYFECPFNNEVSSEYSRNMGRILRNSIRMIFLWFNSHDVNWWG